MHVIPVLDIMNGVVVRARSGSRERYRPIVTPLSPDAVPASVLAGLMALHPFDTVYIADLDAITGADRQDAAIDALADRFRAVEFWVDNGIAEKTMAADWLRRPAVRLVVGTESQTSPALLAALGARAVLSLDFRGEAYVGPLAILNTPALWPRDVIVMTLARVGSGEGPDWERLAEIRRLAGPERRLHAAGGVRGPDDLAALERAGIHGALVATALHDGRLGAFSGEGP